MKNNVKWIWSNFIFYLVDMRTMLHELMDVDHLEYLRLIMVCLSFSLPSLLTRLLLGMLDKAWMR